MHIDFQQGIITYPTFNGQQVFLKKTGSYITLQTANGRTDITFAHGTENYLLTEASDVNNAWGPLLPNTNYWLYWDIDLRTAARTFGSTTIQPSYGPIAPLHPINDQHWFDTIHFKMYRYQTDKWREVVRVFATKIYNNIFYGMGIGITGFPFAGSQVELVNAGLTAGRIIVDNTGTPIRRANGMFFTTEDDFFVNGSPVNVIRLEANIINGTARENIARYQVVKYTSFGHVHLATYNDTQTTMIAMSMEDLLLNQTGTLCVQGIITNPQWNFLHVGHQLWIDGHGLLTETDPHITNPSLHPEGKVPIARVLTPTSIFFDQGLGGKGDKGSTFGDLPLASTTVLGITKLSVPADEVLQPIACGDNDPRLIPYIHPATHPATIISTDTYGFLNGLTAQTQLHQLVDRDLNSLGGVVVPSPTSNDYLKFDGTNWVNSTIIIPPQGTTFSYNILNRTNFCIGSCVPGEWSYGLGDNSVYTNAQTFTILSNHYQQRGAITKLQAYIQFHYVYSDFTGSVIVNVHYNVGQDDRTHTQSFSVNSTTHQYGHTYIVELNFPEISITTNYTLTFTITGSNPLQGNNWYVTAVVVS